MPKKSKIRPQRILYDKKKKKYYVIEKGKKKFLKLDPKKKEEAQKQLLNRPKLRINYNKPLTIDDKIKKYGITFIPFQRDDSQDVDLGLMKQQQEIFNNLKDSPLDAEKLIESKLLENKKLLEDEEKLYPIIKEQANRERKDPLNESVPITVQEVEDVPKVEKKKKKVDKIDKLFSGIYVDLGPVPEKKGEKKFTVYDPNDYLKQEIGSVAYSYVPKEYWIGPNTKVNELYPLIDTIKSLEGMSESRIDEIFADWNILPLNTEIKDDKKRINMKKLRIIYQATPNNVYFLKKRGKISYIRSFPNLNKKPISQYGTGKLPALYSDEIEDFFSDSKEYPNFAGVISSDEIHLLPKKLPLGFIMNLDKSNEPGSHWVAVYINNDSVEYFDPFGKDPSESFKMDIEKFLNSMNLPIMFKFKVNKVQRQHGNSIKCGYHSIRFLDDRFKGIPFDEATGYSSCIKGDNEKDIVNGWKQGEKNVKDEFSYI